VQGGAGSIAQPGRPSAALARRPSGPRLALFVLGGTN